MYDFSDDLVRDLVRQNHVPTEKIIATDDGERHLSIICLADHLPWPCPSRLGYLDWVAANPDLLTSNSADPLDK